MIAEEMEPLLPDRAGAPFPLTSKLRLIVKLLPRVGIMYRNRAVIVDARVIGVRSSQLYLSRIPKKHALAHLKTTRREEIREFRRGWVRSFFPPSTLVLITQFRYCFGGSVAVRIGATDAVNSVVIAHPGGVTPAEAKAIKVGPFHSILLPSPGLMEAPIRLPLLGHAQKVRQILRGVVDLF